MLHDPNKHKLACPSASVSATKAVELRQTVKAKEVGKPIKLEVSLL